MIKIEPNFKPNVESEVAVNEALKDPKTKQLRSFFRNDLTEEEKERAVTEYSERLREQLSGETISVNCMSRLLNMAHPKVSNILRLTDSAKNALLDNTTNKVVRAKSLLDKLSESEREILMNQLKSEKYSALGSTSK